MHNRPVTMLWFPFFFAAATSVLFMLAFAHPEPRDLWLGVVGEAPAQLPKGIALEQVTNNEGVRTNDLAGVYDSGSDTLYVATAASSTRAEYLQKILGPEQTVDLAPSAAGDVSGVSLFFYGLPLLLVGLITSIVLLQLGPWPTRNKVATIAATGAFASGSSFIVAVSQDVIPADGWLLLYGFLLTQTIGWLTTAMARKLRQYFMPAAMTFVLVLGIPTSGATVNADMLPAFLQHLHQILPFGQFIEVARSSAYFGNQHLAGHLIVLLAWAAGSAVLLAWTTRPGREAGLSARSAVSAR